MRNLLLYFTNAWESYTGSGENFYNRQIKERHLLFTMGEFYYDKAYKRVVHQLKVSGERNDYCARHINFLTKKAS